MVEQRQQAASVQLEQQLRVHLQLYSSSTKAQHLDLPNSTSSWG